MKQGGAPSSPLLSHCDHLKEGLGNRGLVSLRRKAEEDRLRKEEEKMRRELIKQEYQQRKQQEVFEEQNLFKPKTPKPKQRPRPKSVLREESSMDSFSKDSSTRESLKINTTLFLSFSHSLYYCDGFYLVLCHEKD